MQRRQVQIGDRMIEIADGKRGGLRWAVGTPDGVRGATWRLWGNKKGDVYLAVRSLGGIVKASFHRDRRCQLGFTEEYQEMAKARFGAASRHWDRWSLPEARQVRAVQVVVPGDDLIQFSAHDAPDMKWLPEPAPGMASVVTVFIEEPPAFRDWPGTDAGATPLGLLTCPTRVTWAVHSMQVLDESTRQHIEEARAKASQMPGASDAPRAPGTRVVVWGREEASNLSFVELGGYEVKTTALVV